MYIPLTLPAKVHTFSAIQTQAFPPDPEYVPEHQHSYTATFGWSNDIESCTATLDFNGETYSDTRIKAVLYANEDPSLPSTGYYVTFYDSQHAYILPEGVKAYSASIGSDDFGVRVVMLTPIEGSILRMATAVLLHSDTTRDMQLIATSEEGNMPENNIFSGVDESTEQDGINYMLSYGQDGLGFYTMDQDIKLSAHKGFLPTAETFMMNAPAIRLPSSIRYIQSVLHSFGQFDSEYAHGLAQY